MNIISSDVDVIICDSCGKGFLTWIPGGVDTEPLWHWVCAEAKGGICGGALITRSRSSAIEIADRYEKVGGEEWLRGKRQP